MPATTVEELIVFFCSISILVFLWLTSVHRSNHSEIPCSPVRS
jgi:hypothetical protein